MCILSVNEFITMCRHETFERMPDEHELEVVVQNASLGNGRQTAEQVHVAVDSTGMNIEIEWGAVRSR